MLRYHVELYRWCLSLLSKNITPRGFYLKKKACLGKVSKNLTEDGQYSEKSAKLLLCLKNEALRMQEKVSMDFYVKSKELTRTKGDELVCCWLMILERCEKTWMNQLADGRRRRFKL